MALDRSWYNTLVDDDGSGLTGSIWDKADVNSLMNAIDAEIARLDAKVTTSGTWFPQIGSSGGGSAVIATSVGRYQKTGQIVSLAGRITLSSKGSLAAGNVQLAGLPFTSLAASTQSGIVFGYFSGVAVSIVNIQSYIEQGVTYAVLGYGAPGGASGFSVLQISQIGPNFDLIFGGSYLAN